MKQIQLNIWHHDDDLENSHKIISVANQIKSVCGYIDKHGCFDKSKMTPLCDNIYDVIDYWVRYTYVGQEKTAKLKSAYQQFFNELYHFVILCSNLPDQDVREFANSALYEGTLYRLLGHGTTKNRRRSVKPIYDGIWVSWNKKPNNRYLESKLYGTKTKLICCTGDIKGLDLSAFVQCAGNEEEVVYPTLKECIINVEYVNKEDSKHGTE